MMKLDFSCALFYVGMFSCFRTKERKNHYWKKYIVENLVETVTRWGFSRIKISHIRSDPTVSGVFSVRREESLTKMWRFKVKNNKGLELWVFLCCGFTKIWCTTAQVCTGLIIRGYFWSHHLLPLDTLYLSRITCSDGCYLQFLRQLFVRLW